MSERDNPEIEPLEDETYTYEYPSALLSDIRIYADDMGVSVEEFFIDAMEHHTMVNMLGGTEVVIEAVRNGGAKSEDRIPYHELVQQYAHAYTEDNTSTVELTFDEVEMQSFMLAFASRYPEGIEVKQQFTQRDQQAGYMHQVTRDALEAYLLRLEAEEDGWQLQLNPNTGDYSLVERHMEPADE